MQISDLRREVRSRVLAFAWEQWTQLGVFGDVQRTDHWAADPEALLLFTLEVARADARLFDEVLDWLALNERLLSVQRLRNLCRDDVDRSLAEAAVAWVAHQKDPGRKTLRHPATGSSGATELFRHVTPGVRGADETFRAYGWLKPRTERSGKSQRPNLLAPINMAFRLRQVLGIGARAEVARVLLTVQAPSVTAQVVAGAAAYAKRNVHEALTALHSAGVIEAVTVGNEQRYRIDRTTWGAFLGLTEDDIPSARDWPQLLHALRVLVRWLEDEEHDKLSDYMLASEARTIADEIVPELQYAGLTVPTGARPGADYWQNFEEIARVATAALR